MDGTPVSGPSFLCQPLRSVQLAQKHRNRPSSSLRSVRPSVPHVGADDSCAGATKTVSPQPSRSDRRTEGGRDGRAERGGRAARWGGMTALSRAVTSRGGTRRRCCGQRRRPRTASTPSCSGGGRGRAGEPHRTDNTAEVFDFDTHRSQRPERRREGGDRRTGLRRLRSFLRMCPRGE